MLLFLAITWFVTCSVILHQPWGDAVERSTPVPVELEEFSVADEDPQSHGETPVRAGGSGSRLCSGLTTEHGVRTAGCSLCNDGK